MIPDHLSTKTDVFIWDFVVEAGYFKIGCIFVQTCNHLSWINGDIIDFRNGNKVVDSVGEFKLKKKYPNILFENIANIWGFPSKL